MLVLNAIQVGVKRSFSTIWRIMKILVPVYFIIKLLEFTGMLEIIALYFEPMMSFFGLPGETAMAYILANALNIYAGLAVMSTLTLTSKQITILGIMVVLSHSLPIETSILKNLGISRWIQVVIRVTASLLAGFLINLVWGWFA